MIEAQGRAVNHHRVMVYLKYFRASYPDVLSSVTCNALRVFFGLSTAMMSACGNPALLDLCERRRGFQLRKIPPKRALTDQRRR